MGWKKEPFCLGWSEQDEGRGAVFQGRSSVTLQVCCSWRMTSGLGRAEPMLKGKEKRNPGRSPCPAAPKDLVTWGSGTSMNILKEASWPPEVTE